MSKVSRIITLKLSPSALKAAISLAESSSSTSLREYQDIAPAPTPPTSKQAKAPKPPKEPKKPKEPKQPKEPKATKKSKKAAAAAAAVAADPITDAPAPSSPDIKDEEDDEVKAPIQATPAPAPTPAPPPKIKLSFSGIPRPKPAGGSGTPTTPKTPVLRLTTSASRPHHRSGAKRVLPLGSGYDSEASDKEEEPAIEEQFILRMQPGEDCDYLRDVIEKRELDKTTDVWLKFKDPRRAVVNVRGHLYAATLVDLPCIIESSKTLDKKNIFKTADISQMLLVGDRIIHEDQVFSIPTPQSLLTYPHGLTPPMHWARKRRFRKRISNRTIEAVEREVERLLEADLDAISANYELIDQQELTRQNSVAAGGEDEEWADEYGDEDAEGEDEEMYEGDYPEGGEGEEEEMDEDAFLTQLESTMMNPDEGGDASGELTGNVNGAARGASATSLTTPSATPAAGGKSGESSDEDEDDDEEYDDGGDMDEDAQEAAQNQQQLREEITDLEETIKSKSRELEVATNSLIKGRIKTQLGSLRAELELKKGQLEGSNSRT